MNRVPASVCAGARDSDDNTCGCCVHGTAARKCAATANRCPFAPPPLHLRRFYRTTSASTPPAAQIAEELYAAGIVSYPRTETQAFDDTIDVRALVEAHAGHSEWGGFARHLTENGGFEAPRAGGKHDGAHPPIHPLRAVEAGELGGDAWRVYALIARHFLACCSTDATGAGTTVTAEVGGEAFTASGNVVLSRGFLDVYPYTKWNDKSLPDFRVGQTFPPARLTLAEGSTQPPLALSERELIQLMDSHGIGTDATIPDLIKKVRGRWREVVVPRVEVGNARGIAGSYVAPRRVWCGVGDGDRCTFVGETRVVMPPLILTSRSVHPTRNYPHSFDCR